MKEARLPSSREGSKHKIIQDRIHVIDLLPTILDISKIKINKELDGISIKSLLLDEAPLTREYLYWDLYGQQSVIYKDWKWINDKRGKDFLFNLKTDGFEMVNLARKNNPVIKKLKKQHKINYSTKFEIPPFEAYLQTTAKTNKHKGRTKIRAPQLRH